MDRTILAMMVLTTYDVTDNARRARLAALLQSVGDRVQKSVFALSITVDSLDEIRSRAGAIIDADEDSLFFFRQCATCWDMLDSIGQAEAPGRTLFWSVL